MAFADNKLDPKIKPKKSGRQLARLGQPGESATIKKN